MSLEVASAFVSISSKGLARVDADMKKAANATKRAGGQMDKALRSSERAIDKVRVASQKASDSVKRGWGGMGRVFSMQNAIIGSAVGVAAASIVELGKKAATFQDVQRSYNTMVQNMGVDSQNLLRSMEQATGGTVSQMTLMKQANQAILLGLPIAEFDKLLSIARNSAITTGQSMEYMVESIVGGVGRMEKEILDNLGIVFSADQAYTEYAATIGKTARSLTDAEKKQAFLTATIKAGERQMALTGGSTESASASFEQFSKAMSDLAVNLGSLILPGLTSLVTKLAEVARSAGDVLGITDIISKSNIGVGLHPDLLRRMPKEDVAGIIQQRMSAVDSLQPKIDTSGWKKYTVGFEFLNPLKGIDYLGEVREHRRQQEQFAKSLGGLGINASYSDLQGMTQQDIASLINIPESPQASETTEAIVPGKPRNFRKMLEEQWKNWHDHMVRVHTATKQLTDQLDSTWEQHSLDVIGIQDGETAQRLAALDAEAAEVKRQIEERVKDKVAAEELITKAQGTYSDMRQDIVEQAAKDYSKTLNEVSKDSTDGFKRIKESAQTYIINAFSLINAEMGDWAAGTSNAIKSVAFVIENDLASAWQSFTKAQGEANTLFDAGKVEQGQDVLKAYQAEADATTESLMSAATSLQDFFFTAINAIASYITDASKQMRGLIEGIKSDLGPSMHNAFVSAIEEGLQAGWSTVQLAERLGEDIGAALSAKLIETIVFTAGIQQQFRTIGEKMTLYLEDGVLSAQESATLKAMSQSAITQGKQLYLEARRMVDSLDLPGTGAIRTRGGNESDTGASVRDIGGIHISEITGASRDILVDLLSPLRRLDILPQLFDSLRTAIYEMRDALLGSGGNGASVHIDNITITAEQGMEHESFNVWLGTEVLQQRRLAGRPA